MDTHHPPQPSDKMYELLEKIYIRAFTEGTKEENKKKRLNELKNAHEKGLTRYMFDLPAFNDAVNSLRKPDGTPYSESGKKNHLQAICRVLKHATDDEILQLFQNLPLQAKVGTLKGAAKQFHKTNAANGGTISNGNQQVPLTDEEKKNWVYQREIQQKFKEALPELFDILERPNPSGKQIKTLYFWMHIALTVLCMRVLRGDAVHIRHQNYENTKDPYIKDGMLHVKAANKTGRTYVTPIPDLLQPLINKMILRSKKNGSDMLFVPQRGNNQMTVSKFNQEYLVKKGKEVFDGRHLTVHLICKAVATADYQRWKQNGGTINQLMQLAANLDHSLAIHLLRYVYEEMNDIQLLPTNVFGATNFDGMAYIDGEAQPQQEAGDEADDEAGDEMDEDTE